MDVSLSELREMVIDREAWHAAIHGVAKSRTRLSDWTELNWTQIQQCKQDEKADPQQVKEQDNCPPNQTKEEEIGNLSDKEFQIMIVKMIQNLEIEMGSDK